MKITKIVVYNFLGLNSFKVDKLGKLNKITGNNGVGKSSVLKAIREAFRSSGVDPYMIRAGAEKAEIFIELDRRVLIERKITMDQNTVTVRHDGQPLANPQTFLNSLLGLGSNFNPVDFFSPKPPKGQTPARFRRELLLNAMPFELTQEMVVELVPEIANRIVLTEYDYTAHGLIVLGSIQKGVYERRHAVNVDVTRMKKAIEQDKRELPETKNIETFKSFNLESKVEELNQIQAMLQGHEFNKKLLQDVTQDIRLTEKRINETSDQIAALQKQLQRYDDELGTAEIHKKSLEAEISEFAVPDPEPIKKQIAEYKDFTKLQHRLEDIERREREVEDTLSEHTVLDDIYKDMTTRVPRKLLSEMKLPIDGLEISGDDILINGVSIDKLSDSEQINLALKIAQVLSGKLKVICVDRFEALDAKSRKLFEETTRDDDFEYFCTVVNQDPESSGELAVEVQ